MFLCFDYMIQASWKTVGHKCMLKKVQGVASRACCKLLKQVESVASRACWKLLQKVESVASRVGCTQNNKPSDNKPSDDVTWSVCMNFTTMLLTYHDPCKLTCWTHWLDVQLVLERYWPPSQGTPPHPTEARKPRKCHKMPWLSISRLPTTWGCSSSEAQLNILPHTPINQYPNFW